MKATRRQFLNTAGVAISASALCSTPWGVLAAPNEVKPAPNMPDPHFIETNGIRMGVYEDGAGFPIVFCHGFPELAYSWRRQIKAFSEAGYRAIAPDQRGYGLTDRPEEVSEYFLQKLCDDMAGLLDALDLDRAIFQGGGYGGPPLIRPRGADLKWDIDVPCLYIGGENDVLLPPSSADHIGNFVKDFERYTVEDCGHETQQEKPDELNRVASDWMKQKFGRLKA